MSKNFYTPPDRSTYDPGWNDPPSMATLPPPTGPTIKPRLNLNKRVAFPVQPGTATTSQNVKTTAEGLPLPFSTAKYDSSRIFNPVADASVPSQGAPSSALPPPPAASLPPPASAIPPTVASALPPPPPTASSTPPTASSFPPPPSSFLLPDSILVPSAAPALPQDSYPAATSAFVESTEFDSTAAREYCRSVFERLLATANSSNDEQKIAEIRKRLDVLQDMWNQSKFDGDMQKVLHQLAKALDANDTSTAMDQHRILGTTYVSLSMHWATALRQLILMTSPNASEDATIPDGGDAAAPANAVQFLDVSSNVAVINAPVLSIQSVHVINQPVASAVNQPVVEQRADDNCDSKGTSSKFGRFGRILHL